MPSLNNNSHTHQHTRTFAGLIFWWKCVQPTNRDDRSWTGMDYRRICSTVSGRHRLLKMTGDDSFIQNTFTRRTSCDWIYYNAIPIIYAVIPLLKHNFVKNNSLVPNQIVYAWNSKQDIIHQKTHRCYAT